MKLLVEDARNLQHAVGVDESDVGVEMIAVMDAMMKPLKQLSVRQIAVVNRSYTHHPHQLNILTISSNNSGCHYLAGLLFSPLIFEHLYYWPAYT